MAKMATWLSTMALARDRVNTTDMSVLKTGRASGCPIGRVVLGQTISLPWLFYPI